MSQICGTCGQAPALPYVTKNGKPCCHACQRATARSSPPFVKPLAGAGWRDSLERLKHPPEK